MSRSSAFHRYSIAALLVLLLGVRLLSPAGFMPTFEHRSVAIVVCTDAEPVPVPMAHHHHHGDPKKLHQLCPYAAGAASATLTEFALFAEGLRVGVALLAGRPFRFLQRHRPYDRPPLRGPPLPA